VSGVLPRPPDGSVVSCRAVTPEDATPAPTLPDYELLRQIGRGAYGDVWLARGVTGVFRAVKIVWRNRFTDARPYEREFRGLTEFAAISLTEARQLALLHVGRAPAAEYFYYVMELADDAVTGREINPDTYVPLTLKKHRDARGRLPVAECVTLGVELARALSGLHTRNLVHRDIKPSNVIFVGGVPKLADIGLVAATSDAQTFIGTEGFVPPEGPGAPSADVFALGKLLYEVSTGQDRSEFPRLPGDLSEIPDRMPLLELNEVIIKACDADATKRHQDASALLSELLLLQAGRSVRRLRLAERSLGRALRAAVFLGIVAVVAGTGAWIERARLARETARRIQAEATLETLAHQSLYTANLNRAQRGLETGDYGLARRALQELVPAAGEADLRGFEWKVLWNQAQGDSADIANVPGHSIVHLCASPDGHRLVSQTNDDRAEIWDMATLKGLGTVEGIHRMGGVSADNKWLLGTDASFGFRRWSLQSGVPDTPQPHSPYRERMIGTLDSDSVVSLGSNDSAVPREIRIWSYSKGAAIHEIPITLPDSRGWDFALGSVSRDHRVCAFAMTRFTRAPLYLWRLQAYDLTNDRLLFDFPTTDRISAIALSFDGRSMAVALADSSQICMVDIATRSMRWKKNAGLGVVEGMAFSPDDLRVIVGGRVSTLLTVAADDGTTVDTLAGQEAGVNEILWVGNNPQVFSGGSTGDIRRWHLNGPRNLSSFPGFFAVSLSTQPLCLSDDGNLFAAPETKNSLVWGSIDSRRPMAKGLVGQIPLGFDRDNKGLAAIAENGILYRYRMDDRGHVTTASEDQLVNESVGIEDAGWSSDHTDLIIAGRNGSMNFFNLKTGTHSTNSSLKRGQISWINVSSDGKFAVSGGLDDTVRLWSVGDGSLLRKWEYTSDPYSAAFSPDGSIVAICFSNGEAEIRRLDDGIEPTRLKSDFAALEAIAFLPDGRRLFLGGPNGSIQVFDCSDWRPLVTLGDNNGPDAGDRTIARIAVASSGTTLMAYRADGRLSSWHFSPNTP
jgi:WD40 repeat protein